MHAQVNIALSHSDFSVLRELSEGNISRTVQETIENLDLETVKAQLDIQKTTCRIDLNLAKKLQDVADALGVAPGRVVRAALEARLHKTHH